MAFTKNDLIDHVAKEASLSKADANKAVEAILGGLTQALKEGREARLIGFGAFSVQQTPAREGRNPRSGETIQIAASKKPIFKAGKGLKEAVNKA